MTLQIEYVEPCGCRRIAGTTQTISMCERHAVEVVDAARVSAVKATPIDFATYQKIGAVNWSTLKAMQRSPLHYRHALDTPSVDKMIFVIGRATHAAILEPEKFATEYAIAPDVDRRTKEGKAAHAAALEAADGRELLKPDDHALACAMRDAVWSHPVAASYLTRGHSEVTIGPWTDPETGIVCKGRADWIARDENGEPCALVDVKTCATIDGRQFGAAAARYGYHEQLALYQQGLRVTTGHLLPCVIVAVEKTAPHDVAVFLVGEDDLALGWSRVRPLLARVAECRESGVWPGQYPAAVPLELPRWAIDSDDADWTVTETD